MPLINSNRLLVIALLLLLTSCSYILYSRHLYLTTYRKFIIEPSPSPSSSDNNTTKTYNYKHNCQSDSNTLNNNPLQSIFEQPNSCEILNEKEEESMRSLRNLAMELMKEETPSRTIEALRKEYGKYYKLKPERLNIQHQSSFLQTELDQETYEFVMTTPRWNSLTNTLNSLLSFFYTKTDCMGYLGMGNMFILSTDQYGQLFQLNYNNKTKQNIINNNNNQNNNNIDNNNIDNNNIDTTSDILQMSMNSWENQLPLANITSSYIKFGSLLDVGSGCGTTTLQLKPLFREVAATEASVGMVYSLRRKGIDAYYCTDLDTLEEIRDRQFDVVSCLNVLDRCERPLSLLRSMRRFIRPDGRLLLATVYPFKPYVEFGGNDNKPFELLNITNNSVEEFISSMVTEVLEPEGFKLQSFTKGPYISEGDQYYANYVLVDIVFVLTLGDDPIIRSQSSLDASTSSSLPPPSASSLMTESDNIK
ncbi:putative DREV methyltransferase [Cavenderia fasciculata]|uniref:DREV methyltransferase n=1 Tax=Cavenderia fasciculata TaxID=261658 RepID=F4PUS1_CACFS|nr:putative DREV methyltransferase [Cavenderia fasciculata]EGG21090.1 putative DREV methyltransferase [Cavenderia fasciculata]|eukprot:XP_004358940.1 putative DREV methyltransferase [Cavenderia fasciculata]